MTDRPDFFPTATLEQLRLRARLLAAVRRFFDSRGYWEVDTPILSHDGVVDAHLDAFLTRFGTPVAGGMAEWVDRRPALFLQTSPEFAMKRLLCAGADAIYQLGKVFRNGERGTRHNPEFTMVEWYRVGDTHWAQMQVVEDLVREILQTARRHFEGAPPAPTEESFLRTSYREAFERHTGCDVLRASMPELTDLARSRGVIVPESLSPADRDGWLNLLLAELVEPNLGRGRPEFVYDYPASQAALARVRSGEIAVGERFELYVDGLELCNGYHELTDADELRRRIRVESERRQAEGQAPLALSNRLLEAMDNGLPNCAGVALGFDRLMMVAVGARTIDEVIAFPFERA